MTGQEIVARARSWIGVRFRPQGRCAASGTDCIGLAGHAAGVPMDALARDYKLRGQAAARIESELRGLGLGRVSDGEAAPGDILVMEAGPAQLHVGVFTGSGIVHADAGIGAVVERPAPISWPILSQWRQSGED